MALGLEVASLQSGLSTAPSSGRHHFQSWGRGGLIDGGRATNRSRQQSCRLRLAFFVRRAIGPARGDGGWSRTLCTRAALAKTALWQRRGLKQRRPMLLLRSAGVSLLRLPARKLVAELLKLPPRITRLEALVAVAR